MKKHCVRAAALLLLGSHYVLAATEYNPMIVTATRTAQKADETLASVTVISREEIERRQVQSVQDLLRGVPGVGVTNNGGLGKATSVFIRGTESDHVLVLIDGIRVSSATLGTASFQNFPVDQIERIEIVRGPRASLYGSDAIGGVIQIFTRRDSDGLTPQFGIGGGSHQTYKVSGGLSGTVGNAWFNFNASHLDSEGFNACRGLPFPPGGGCFTSEPDHDGFTDTSGSARAGYQFANGLEIEGHLLHSEGDTEFDGGLTNQSDFVQQVAGGKLAFSPLEIWHISVSGGRSLDETENLLNSAFRSRFDTERWHASLQNDIDLAPDHLLTLGMDYYDDQVDSTTVYTQTSRDNIAGFGQYQGTFGNFDVVAAVRHDENEQFGGSTTGSAAWGYTFGPLLRVTAGYGTAFKAPSFNELFFPGFGTPSLDPEESHSWEMGVSGRLAGVDWAVSGYYTGIDNLIIGIFDMAICPPPFFFCAQNVGEARILGLDASASTTVLGWDVSATFSQLDPEDRGGGATDGNLLPRRAQTLFRVDVDRDLGPFSVGGSVFGEGRRFDDLANTRRLDGYVLLDLRAAVELHKHWILEGRAGNVLDKDYETARLFNQDGRNFFVNLRYQP